MPKFATYSKHYAVGCSEHGQIKYSKTSEERRKNKRRSDYKNRFLGYKGKWTVAFTLTSGIAKERKDCRRLISIANKYMSQSGVDYNMCLDIGDNGNWHIHGVASDYFDILPWMREHKCNPFAVFCQTLYKPVDVDGRKVSGLVRYVNYILQNVDRIPKGIHACRASYRSQKPVTIIRDKHGKLVYTSLKYWNAKASNSSHQNRKVPLIKNIIRNIIKGLKRNVKKTVKVFKNGFRSKITKRILPNKEKIVVYRTGVPP